VASCTRGQLESPPSRPAVLSFAEREVLPAVGHLRATPVAPSAVTLSWDALSSPVVDGYRVSWGVHTDDAYPLPWAEANTNQATINLTALPPGAKCAAKVFAFKEDFHGPDEVVYFITPGKPLPKPQKLSSSVNGTKISLTWDAVTPDDASLGSKWAYAVYMIGTLSAPHHLGNTEMPSYVVEQPLEPCRPYSFQVRVSVGTERGPLLGPPSNPLTAQTDFSPLAAPRLASAVLQESHSQVLVRWEASCTHLPKALGYKVFLVEKQTGRRTVTAVPATSSAMVSVSLGVHPGGVYSVWVSTDQPGALMSAPADFAGPELPAPLQLAVVPEMNGSLFVHWKEPILPASLSGHRVTYMVLVSKREDMADAETYNASQPPLTIPSVPGGQTYHVAVRLLDEHGFQSAMSTRLSVGVLAGPLSIGTGGLVGVVLGVLAVLLALGVLLAVVAVRHRRLQRSFVSFANSHYDTRSGATTFSTGGDNAGLAGDEDDDDEPIIRGFSDDEPLVIA
ncbi:unnamed protein product, partial [Ixodes hexagonus]